MPDIDEHRQQVNKPAREVIDLILERSNTVSGGLTVVEMVTVLEIVKALLIAGDEAPVNVFIVKPEGSEPSSN